jgi:hypothetical protein
MPGPFVWGKHTEAMRARARVGSISNDVTKWTAASCSLSDTYALARRFRPHAGQRGLRHWGKLMVMNEYRRYAADCLRIADNSTISPEDKIVLTAIAQAWLRLAQRAETDSYVIQKSVDRQPEGQPGERNVRRRPNRTRR